MIAFLSPPPNNRPYTIFRKPNTYSILDYNLIAKHHALRIRTCRVLQNALPGSVTDHKPIHLCLNLPTSPNPVPAPPSHTSAPSILYHSKRLKDPQTKNAYTATLAIKVAKIPPIICKVLAQLDSRKYFHNSSLTLQLLQLPKACNTRHM